MSLTTLNIEEEDKALFLQLKLKYQAVISKELSQAEFFNRVLTTYKRGGV